MSETSEPSPPRRTPWDFHPALTEERLIAAARLLVRGREEALTLADYYAGDDAWSIGCRAYSFSRHQVSAAAKSGRYPWLKVLDPTHHFVFLIDDVPVRFFRGEADEPTKRTLHQQQREAGQLSLAFGSDIELDGLMFRLALESEDTASISRVVFLALRGEGQVECFWPVPMAEPEQAQKAAPRTRTNNAPSLQLPLLAAADMPSTPKAPASLRKVQSRR